MEFAYAIYLTSLRLRPMRCAAISSTWIPSPNTPARAQILFNTSFKLQRLILKTTIFYITYSQNYFVLALEDRALRRYFFKLLSSPMTHARAHSPLNASFTLQRPHFGAGIFSLTFHICSYHNVERLRLQPMRCALITLLPVSSPGTHAMAHSPLNASFTLQWPRFWRRHYQSCIQYMPML